MINVLDNHFLIKELIPENKTNTGLIIPESAQGETREGLVIKSAKYEGRQDNNIVIYKKGAGTKINYKQNEYTVIERSDILAVYSLPVDEIKKIKEKYLCTSTDQ